MNEAKEVLAADITIGMRRVSDSAMATAVRHNGGTVDVTWTRDNGAAVTLTHGASEVIEVLATSGDDETEAQE